MSKVGGLEVEGISMKEITHMIKRHDQYHCAFDEVDRLNSLMG